MLRLIVCSLFMLVWGTVTIVTGLKSGKVSSETWTIPALGLGGLLTALSVLDGKKKDEEAGSSEKGVPPVNTAEDAP